MTYLHSQDITHRDLKVTKNPFPPPSHAVFRPVQSMNVLLDESYNAKIADFGESIIERSNRSGTGAPQHVETGTAGWAAPETILGKEATKASDVFSFGVVLWELLTWRVPSVMITVETLLEESVRRHPSTCDHPLLAIVKEQRNPRPPKKERKERGDHGPSSSSGGFLGAVFSGEAKGGSFKNPAGTKNPIHAG
jgi:serine/threonine protein kinase